MTVMRNKFLFLATILFCSVSVCSAHAQPGDLPILVHLDLRGDKAVADKLPSLNAEVLVTLEKSGKYKLISEEQLSNNLLMSPAENLEFCAYEPGCIASMGASVKARWLLYGDVKLSFDGSKILVHMVLIDVPGEKLEKEKHGQFEAENAALATGDMLRSMLGLKARKVKPVAVVIEPPPSEKRKDKLKSTKKLSAGSISRTAPQSQNSPWRDPLMWSVAGVGAACMATATTLGLLSLDRQDQAKTLAVQADPLGAEERFHEADDMALGANILFGVGSAALAAAVVFLVLDITDDTPATTVPMVSCNGHGCAGSFTITF